MRALMLSAVIATGLGACVDSQPTVVLETEQGNIVLSVDTQAAPISGGDFLRYVDQGLYDGQGFYRVVNAGNDPLGQGMSLVQGGRLNLEPVPGDAFVGHEPTGQTGLSNIEGSISLARNQVGTGSAAFFFVNLGDNSFLDQNGGRNPDGAGYAVFGRVEKGMDTLRAIQAGATAPDEMGLFSEGQKLAEPVYILKAYRK